MLWLIDKEVVEWAGRPRFGMVLDEVTAKVEDLVGPAMSLGCEDVSMWAVCPFQFTYS